MSACEKCWSDAYFRSRTRGGSQSDRYQQILEERKDNPCTPSEQAGQFWDDEREIDIRTEDE